MNLYVSAQAAYGGRAAGRKRRESIGDSAKRATPSGGHQGVFSTGT